MDSRDLDLFLLGVGVGVLGAAAQIGDGAKPEELEAHGRECLDVAARSLNKTALHDRARLERLESMVAAFRRK